MNCFAPPTPPTLRSPQDHESLAVQAVASPAFAVISDIHSNLTALRAVLAEIDRRGIKAIVCLGDIVGYGPRPAECLRELRDREIPCLRGNHDEMAASCFIPHGVSAGAEAGIHFTIEKLKRKDTTFLATLPWSLEVNDFSFVHSSFPRPEDFDYVYGGESAVTHLMQQPTRVSWFGHTHVQGGLILERGKLRPLETAQPSLIHTNAHSAFNPGSVGQPRDNDPRAAFGICHPATGKMEFVRVEYDFRETMTEMVQAGLPVYLAARLRLGT